MLTKLFGAAVQGIDATIVTIEVNSSRGIKFFLVGLPDSAVKESHERIMSALQVNGYKFPTCQIVVNMAPADIRKEGSSYDLPLAIGILAATGTVSSDKLNRYLIIGELGLDGNLQPIKGALPIAICAREQGLEGLILPKQNAREAAVVNNLKVFGVENITEVIEFFNGIRTLELFLDELPEFNRSVLEVLRQPLEDRRITISRSKYTLEYPASFTLIASMNPCPCGYYNHPTRHCVCSPGQVQRYLNKISGPLLDRIDIQIEIVPVPFEKLSEQTKGESSAAIRERVIRARQIQASRFAHDAGVHCNAQMSSRLLHQYALPDEKGLSLLRNAMERFHLSARAYDRILKVSRTIADLENAEHIQPHHLAEAISYRNLDRENWSG